MRPEPPGENRVEHDSIVLNPRENRHVGNVPHVVRRATEAAAAGLVLTGRVGWTYTDCFKRENVANLTSIWRARELIGR